MLDGEFLHVTGCVVVVYGESAALPHHVSVHVVVVVVVVVVNFIKHQNRAITGVVIVTTIYSVFTIRTVSDSSAHFWRLLYRPSD